MKLPPRRILRSIVQDAISDREEMEDFDSQAKTMDLIDRYQAFLPRLADDAPPLSSDDRHLLATACMHARIWREGYADAWAGTGDKAVIAKARQRVDRVTRTEAALGVATPFIIGGAEPAGMTTINLSDLMAMNRKAA